MGQTPRLKVDIGGLKLDNPVMTASGTFGYGEEFSQLTDIDRLGAIVAKGISLLPRPGNPPPRICETAAGLLNAIGLENVGIKRFIREKVPFLRRCGTKVIANILGDRVEDYGELCAILSDCDGVDAIEVNISCPNVKKGGMAFGTDPDTVAEITKTCKENSKLPVIIKLSPNVTDITLTARAAAAAGADALSLINTITAMAIDTEKRKAVLGNIIGGLSGPAIKPVALRMVWQTAQAVDIPLIGIGGIMTATDAIEFILAGATAVQVGTANFINPGTGEDIVHGLSEYMNRHGTRDINELRGAINS